MIERGESDRVLAVVISLEIMQS